MNDIKNVIAKNIHDLRKSVNLTQAQFAEKINYTDKAVSKWERAESIPDVVTLKEIVDLFGVSMDYLFETEHKTTHSNDLIIKKQKRRRLIVTLLSISLVVLIATLAFVFLGIYSAKVQQYMWMVYMYAIPVTCVVLFVFNSIWGKRKTNLFIVSVLIWSVLLCIYLSFLSYNIWLIFTIGIPAEFIIILWGSMYSSEGKKS